MSLVVINTRLRSAVTCEKVDLAHLSGSRRLLQDYAQRNAGELASLLASANVPLVIPKANDTT